MRTKEIKDYLCLSKEDEDKELLIDIGLSYFIYGDSFIENLKLKYKKAKILINLKVNDCDYLNAKVAFDAGADVISILACASNDCIKNTLNIAKENQKEVILDLSGVDHLSSKLEDLSILGVTSIMNFKANHYINDYDFDNYSYYVNTFEYINIQLNNLYEQI